MTRRLDIGVFVGWMSAVVGAVVMVGALHGQPVEPRDDPSREGVEFFEKNIRPILVDHCYECHAGSESNGGFRLDSREAIRKGGESGLAIQSGAANESRLIQAVRYQNPDLQMPPKNRLSSHQVELLERWIELGAPDPRESNTTTHSNPSGMTIEEGKKFWSMKPLLDVKLPRTNHENWVQTPIDAWVLEKLNEKGLRPVKFADKRQLLRRATFDLIGLPPTYDQLEAFLADDSPHAFSKVIERLLQSPEYGLRWGRHWLDVARYADSNGLDENLAFGTAWRYRDYVIDSLNSDKPFDRFLIEQIAGDLIPDENQQSRTATAFLVLGAKVLAEPDRDKLVMDTIDEQIDTLGKAFLGMTFGCSRCHDHKFDPIHQSDYYSLAAIFKSTQTFGTSNTGAIKHWNETNFGTSEELLQIKNIESKIAEKQKAANEHKAAAFSKIRNDARALATDYLVVCSKFSLDATLEEIAVLAEPLGLHPRILHHCRRHLEYHRDSALFRDWHDFMESGQLDRIDCHYRPLFESAMAAWDESVKKDKSTKSLADPELEKVRSALYDPSGFLAVPSKPGFAFDRATLVEYYRLAEEARLLESFSPDVPSAMSVCDGLIHAELPVYIRGNHRNPGQSVARQFPQVMAEIQPVFPRAQSGRLQLAQWMSDSRHPLTARVYVNRVWGWHFGNALVRSTENFGVLGERPTHPELLDWLARYLIESGWSTKELHRVIMNSSVYQLSCDGDLTASNTDPENRYLSHFPTLRLDAEQLRDSILFVAGQLDWTKSGKTVPLRNRQFVFDHTSIDHTQYDSFRRTIYLPVIRNNLYSHFEQFDFPDPTMPTGHRNTTTVAPQALLLMNSDWVLHASTQMAIELMKKQDEDERRVMAAFQRCFCRNPGPGELERSIEFIAAANRDSENQTTAWALFCQSLMASNEFIFLR